MLERIQRVVFTVVVLLLPAVPATAGLVERGFLERNGRRHGEVRVVRQDSCISVRTLLYSPVLRRAVREIANKERAASPDGSRLAADREHYLLALDAARTVAERSPAGSGDDRRRFMLIDFSRCGDVRSATVGGLRLSGSPDAFEIAERPDERRLELSPEWIDARMRAVAADALALDERRLDELFAP